MDVTNLLEPIGQSSTGNAFTFDPATGNWVFTLGTKAFTAAGIYTVTAKAGDTSYLDDGTALRYQDWGQKRGSQYRWGTRTSDGGSLCFGLHLPQIVWLLDHMLVHCLDGTIRR